MVKDKLEMPRFGSVANKEAKATLNSVVVGNKSVTIRGNAKRGLFIF